ncbi:MAG: DCC1-like thiol-disulfide oxidoreductase family protein, partial [Pseudomonadota bacterium]
RIAAAGSPLGRALFVHYGLDPDDPESWLYLEDGRVRTGFEGMARVGARCGGPLAAIRFLMILPPFVRRWLYARVARNRIAVFGRADICAVPDPAFRARLIE